MATKPLHPRLKKQREIARSIARAQAKIAKLRLEMSRETDKINALRKQAQNLK